MKGQKIAGTYKYCHNIWHYWLAEPHSCLARVTAGTCGVLCGAMLARLVRARLLLARLVRVAAGGIHGGGELVVVVLAVQVGVVRHALLHHAELLIAVAAFRFCVTATITLCLSLANYGCM